jgi:hypothetical protein
MGALQVVLYPGNTMRVTEGTIGNYEVSLSRPVQVGTSVSVYVFLGGFARDLTLLTPLGFSFNFTYEGVTAWNVRQLVGFQVRLSYLPLHTSNKQNSWTPEFWTHSGT